MTIAGKHCRKRPRKCDRRRATHWAPSFRKHAYVTKAGAARTLLGTEFAKQAAWPFAIDWDYECSLGRLVAMEIEATKTFEMAKEFMTNEDELIRFGFCEAAVTKKMAEVKEAGLHLPYRRFRSASLILASKKWLAEAKSQRSV